MNLSSAVIPALGIGLLVVVGSTGRVPGASEPTSNPDCQVTSIAEDGTPPPDAPRLDPQRLCDALDQAEKQADCMGDYQPPNPDRVNARELCLEVQRRGCGDPGRDCDRVPADQTYYHHH